MNQEIAKSNSAKSQLSNLDKRIKIVLINDIWNIYALNYLLMKICSVDSYIKYKGNYDNFTFKMKVIFEGIFSNEHEKHNKKIC